MSDHNNCSHNCSSCASGCPSGQGPKSLLKPANQHSKIKKVVGVISGKGGVGKSLVTALLATAMQKKGHQCAILDADITGPSIPRMFGLSERAKIYEQEILPVEAANHIKIMSVNLLLANDTDPVVWRGPMIGGAVEQFWTDVCWGDIDYLFVDMPPGTGDVAQTVFQSLPVDGIIVVSSPQDLVGMIVEKAVKMADMVHIPVLGLVENMAYFQCPSCGDQHAIFGESHLEQWCRDYQVELRAQVPIDPALAQACDRGDIHTVDAPWLKDLVVGLEAL